MCVCVCRTRAAVPQPSRMDFVINPGSRLDPLDGPMQSGVKSKPGGGKPKVRQLACCVLAGACGPVAVLTSDSVATVTHAHGDELGAEH
jgi:hypothetical protein